MSELKGGSSAPWPPRGMADSLAFVILNQFYEDLISAEAAGLAAFALAFASMIIGSLIGNRLTAPAAPKRKS